MIDETKIKLQPIKVPVDTHEVDFIYRSLIKVIGDEKITTLNIVLIATNLMQLVEGYPKLNGSDKKTLVIHILKRVVEDSLEGDSEEAVIIFIDMFLPSVIDTIISVDKKELSVKMKKRFKSCVPMC
jgi:hypothetical protein